MTAGTARMMAVAVHCAFLDISLSGGLLLLVGSSSLVSRCRWCLRTHAVASFGGYVGAVCVYITFSNFRIQCSTAQHRLRFVTPDTCRGKVDSRACPVWSGCPEKIENGDRCNRRWGWRERTHPPRPPATKKTMNAMRTGPDRPRIVFWAIPKTKPMAQTGQSATRTTKEELQTMFWSGSLLGSARPLWLFGAGTPSGYGAC